MRVTVFPLINTPALSKLKWSGWGALKCIFYERLNFSSHLFHGCFFYLVSQNFNNNYEQTLHSYLLLCVKIKKPSLFWMIQQVSSVTKIKTTPEGGVLNSRDNMVQVCFPCFKCWPHAKLDSSTLCITIDKHVRVDLLNVSVIMSGNYIDVLSEIFGNNMYALGTV